MRERNRERSERKKERYKMKDIEKIRESKGKK